MKAGWEIAQIGEVCSLQTGGTPSRSKPEYFEDGHIKWLVSGDIHSREIYDCEGRITSEGLSNSNAKLLPIGSVMIALNGQGKTRGTVAMLRTEATCNQSLVSIMPNDTDYLLPEFLFCNLHARYEEIRRMTGDAGNERRGLNMGLIRGIRVPIPPLEEQRRIVAVLDEAFEGLARARENTEANLASARELFERCAERVFSTYLTTSDAQTVRLDDVAELRGGYAFKSKQYTESGHFVLRTVNITVDGEIIKDNPKFIAESAVADYERFVLQPFDILFVMVGATLGKTGFITSESLPALLNQNMWVIRANQDLVRPLFLYHLFRIITRPAIEKATGTARGFLRRDDVRSLRFVLPSRGEQQEVVEHFEEIRQRCLDAEESYGMQLADLDDLRQSLLQKAFAGELT